MRRYLWAVAFLSGAVLASQVALTRIFAFLIWYHGVFLIISMAMLGFAASGSILTLGGEYFRREPGFWIRFSGLFFAVFVLIGIFLPAFFPIESQGLSVDSGATLVRFGLHFFYWGLAFMMGGAAIILVLQIEKERIHATYFSSMAGSGAGCLLALGLLYRGPGVALGFVSLMALVAFWIVPGKRIPVVMKTMAILSAFAAIALVAGFQPNWKVAESKVEYYRLAHGRVLENHWSPISLVQVFEGPPGWDYVDSGLAIHLRTSMPGQKGIIIDAYAQSVFTEWSGESMEAFDFYPQSSTSAAYHLRANPRVLVIGVGGGIDVLRALYFNAVSIVGVELNGVLIDLLREKYRDFTGNLAFHPRVRLVKDEGRSYVRHSSEEFDVVQINYTDTWSSSASGGLALAENFIYTAEAIQDYWRRLSPDGIISITRTLSYPHEGETLRVALTAAKALRDLGIAVPRRHLMIVASVMENAPNPHTSATLLIGKRPFTAAETDHLIDKGRGRWLLVFRPDKEPLPPISEIDAPLGEKYYQEVKRKIEYGRDTYNKFITNFPDDTKAVDEYEFDVSPLSDNKPFYYFFTRWGRVWDSFLAGRISGHAGGAILLVALSLALLGSILGIILPLLVWQIKRRRHSAATARRSRAGLYGLYFAGLGFGFIALEINLIQMYAMFLGHPVYSLVIVLAGLLLFSGIGSFLSGRVPWRTFPVTGIFLGIMAAAIALLVLPLPGLLFRWFAGTAIWQRSLIMLLIIAPLGVLMGMPFPLGLRETGREDDSLIPWFWGVNGFTSVIGSIVAAILAIAFGYRSLSWAGISAYAIAMVAAFFLLKKKSVGLAFDPH